MKIALLGDIALIGRYDRLISDDVDKRIASVKKIVRNCDYVIANLESPLTRKQQTFACKGVYLRSDPQNVLTLKRMGVTHVTLANNHIFDYGKKGAEDTIKTLKRAGIKFVGLGYPSELLQTEDTRVLIDGFCCLSANALNYGHSKGHVRLMTPETLEDFLKKAKEKRAIPLVSAHFGLEGLHYPSVEHVYLFRKLAENYDYILHGNHPHAIQGYEQYNKSLLLYAQGNLCFDEATVNSIHCVPKEKDEERKSYISIIEVSGTNLLGHEVHTMTDLRDDRILEDERIREELTLYNSVLKTSLNELSERRQEELAVQKRNATVRNLQFYLNRLNYKYIGAYLNGKIHAKKYRNTICKYYVQFQQ